VASKGNCCSVSQKGKAHTLAFEQNRKAGKKSDSRGARKTSGGETKRQKTIWRLPSPAIEPPESYSRGGGRPHEEEEVCQKKESFVKKRKLEEK